MTAEYLSIEPTKIISRYPAATAGSKGTQREPNSFSTTTNFDIMRPKMPSISDVTESSVHIATSTVQTEGEFRTVPSREIIAWVLVTVVILLFIGLISAYSITIGWKYWKRQKRNIEDQIPILHEMASNPSNDHTPDPDNSMKTNNIIVNEAAETEKENNL